MVKEFLLWMVDGWMVDGWRVLIGAIFMAGRFAMKAGLWLEISNRGYFYGWTFRYEGGFMAGDF